MKNILFLAANPSNTSRLRLDQEFRDIQEALQRSQEQNEFLLRSWWAVRSSDLQQAILDIEPQIVHISGAGVEAKGFVFEDEVGKPKIIKGDALANLFKVFSNVVECVILNSSYSYLHAEIINQYVPYVISMNDVIEDRAAIEFSSGFYRALGKGRSMQFAYELGCNAVHLAGLVDYKVPKLYENKKMSEIYDSHQVFMNKVRKENPVEVFVSYNQKDRGLFQKFKLHLDVLQQEGIITVWEQSEMIAGSIRDEEINKHIESAKLILLVVSPSFFSDSNCNRELSRAIERHEAREAIVVPIHLRHVDFRGTLIAKLKALPNNNKPINRWVDKDEAFFDVVNEIRKILQ